MLESAEELKNMLDFLRYVEWLFKKKKVTSER